LKKHIKSIPVKGVTSTS